MSPARRDRGHGACPPRRTAALRCQDRALSEVIGSLLLAGITVSMAVTFGPMMLERMPADAGPPPSTLEIGIEPGSGGWGDGDERVTLRHTGGSPLLRNHTTIEVLVGPTLHKYEGPDLGSVFQDGSFTIGERWQVGLSIPPSTTVDVQAVRNTPAPAIVAGSSLQSGGQDCRSDRSAPTVSTWTQSPTTIPWKYTGPVTVTGTLNDACAGVDTSSAPHLWFRFNGTTQLSDAGTMTHLSGTTWQGIVPEPVGGWVSRGGHTLFYRIDPLQDRASNVGISQERATTVEAKEQPSGELTYATDHVIFSGTLTEFPAAQNASDGGASTVLRENATSPAATTSEAYGTAHSSRAGAQSPGHATGSPDNVHAVLSTDDDWIGVEGFQTFSGEITSVEIALKGYHNSSVLNDDDRIGLSYRVGTKGGRTSESYGPSELSSGADGPTMYLNVTGDRSWTWEDVRELQIRSTYERTGSADDIGYFIDALWVRIAYNNPAYNMSIRADVLNLPSGRHSLELRYKVSEETHHLEVWNFTSGTWETKATALTASSLRNWSAPLTSDQVSMGAARFRVVDASSDPTRQSTVEIDYWRVRTR